MAFIAVGAAALGFAGLSMYANPGKKEAEEMAQQMFGKSLQSCTPVEKNTIDMAAGIPKLEGIRDGFQSLFPRPKPRSSSSNKSESRGSRDRALPAGFAEGSSAAPQQPEDYALYDDPDVDAIYPVHEDTADPDQRYLAHYSNLKNLVPFDIETESLEDEGTYDVEEFLKTHQRLPQTLTLPRQLGGAATSANLLINKLTAGSRASLPEGYVLPGQRPDDDVHPPTDHELELPPPEATRSLRELVDYQHGAGEYQRGLPEPLARELARRIIARQEAAKAAAEAGSEYDDEDESEYDDEESEEEESEEEEAVVVRAPARAAAPVGQGARTRAPVRVQEDSEDEEDEDEEESD